MSKVVVLGAGGMLGHKMFQTLSGLFPDTYGTLRTSRKEPPFARIDLFQTDRIIDGVDVSDLDRVDSLLRELRPHVVVNCTGVIKQRRASADAIPSITVNALLPHRVAHVLTEWGGRLIHFSTDCVFSGSRGSYTETDPSDAADLYGQTKFLGEAAAENALTLRTSIIGRELQYFQSLLEWFLRQQSSSVFGFRRVFWSGVTTNHLARLVGDIIARHPDLHGLYQVSSGTISKYDLLLQVKDAFRLGVEVKPEDETFCDRSLVGDKFSAAIGYQCPSWPELLREVATDPTPYAEWLGQNATVER
jgi:dTDP-4-dehydrorhamnose reductase